MIDSITAASMINIVQELCEKGSEIVIGKTFIEKGGRRLWSIRGAGVTCSGWETFEECFEKWIDAVEYLDEREVNTEWN